MTAAETAFRAEVDEYCAVRPERLNVTPAGDGLSTRSTSSGPARTACCGPCSSAACWLTRAFEAHPTSAEGGRGWALSIGPVPADRVGELIGSCVW